MRKAVFAGSFDPLTNGHLDIIERAAQLFDQVVVAVLVNVSKQAHFSVERRVQMICDSTTHLPSVRVDQFSGLVATYVQRQGATAFVRGVRTEEDFAVEWRLATMNRELTAGVDTVLFPTKAQWAHVSSSLIKEIAGFGGDIAPYVPPSVLLAFSGE